MIPILEAKIPSSSDSKCRIYTFGGNLPPMCRNLPPKVPFIRDSESVWDTDGNDSSSRSRYLIISLSRSGTQYWHTLLGANVFTLLGANPTIEILGQKMNKFPLQIVYRPRPEFELSNIALKMKSRFPISFLLQ